MKISHQTFSHDSLIRGVRMQTRQFKVRFDTALKWSTRELRHSRWQWDRWTDARLLCHHVTIYFVATATITGEDGELVTEDQPQDGETPCTMPQNYWESICRREGVESMAVKAGPTPNTRFGLTVPLEILTLHNFGRYFASWFVL